MNETVCSIGQKTMTGENQSTHRKKLYQCYFVHHESHKEWAMSPWCEASKQLPIPQNSSLSTSVRDGMKAILCLHKTGTASVWLPKSIQKVAWAHFVPCQSCNHFADISTIRTTGIFKTIWLQKPRKYRKTRVSMDGPFAKIKMGKKS